MDPSEPDRHLDLTRGGGAFDDFQPMDTRALQRAHIRERFIDNPEGRIVVHGGGASMVAQSNDTDYHVRIRSRFIELYGNGKGPRVVDSTVDRAPCVGRTAAEKKDRNTRARKQICEKLGRLYSEHEQRVMADIKDARATLKRALDATQKVEAVVAAMLVVNGCSPA